MSNGSVYLSAQVRREVGLYGQQRGEAIMWSHISILYAVRSAHVREGQHRGGATSRASYGRYGDDAVTGGTDKRMHSRESSFNVGPTSAT
jgi:hypothetical protein